MLERFKKWMETIRAEWKGKCYDSRNAIAGSEGKELEQIHATFTAENALATAHLNEMILGTLIEILCELEKVNKNLESSNIFDDERK